MGTPSRTQDHCLISLEDKTGPRSLLSMPNLAGHPLNTLRSQVVLEPSAPSLHQPTCYCFVSCRLPYKNIFGGATAFTARQFVKVNGFSNRFYGWGGEDDDMSGR